MKEFKPKFDLQLFSEDVIDESIDEPIDDVIDDSEVDTDDEITESDFELDYKYNDEEGVWTDKDEVRTLAQKGMNYDKIYEERNTLKEQVENLIKPDNPLYSWAKNYMEQTGFKDEQEFLKAIDINNRQKNYVKNGMDEASAKQRAEMDYRINNLEEKLSAKEQQEKEEQEMEDFLNWHSEKVKDGVFDSKFEPDSIPAEVWQKVEEGTALKTAYMEYQLANMKKTAEQEVLKNLDKNGETSTGSVKKDTKDNDGANGWSVDYINKMIDKHGESWVDENFEKIEQSGYFQKY